MHLAITRRAPLDTPDGINISIFALGDALVAAGHRVSYVCATQSDPDELRRLYGIGFTPEVVALSSNRGWDGNYRRLITPVGPARTGSDPPPPAGLHDHQRRPAAAPAGALVRRVPRSRAPDGQLGVTRRLYKRRDLLVRGRRRRDVHGDPGPAGRGAPSPGVADPA